VAKRTKKLDAARAALAAVRKQRDKQMVRALSRRRCQRPPMIREQEVFDEELLKTSDAKSVNEQIAAYKKKMRVVIEERKEDVRVAERRLK
jgi:hypothetical protein